MPPGTGTGVIVHMFRPCCVTVRPPIAPTAAQIGNLNAGTAAQITVLFGGAAATTKSNISFGQLTAVVPPGATNGPITITTTNGTFTTTDFFYLPPQITGFTPTTWKKVPDTRLTAIIRPSTRRSISVNVA